jgi:predicted metal-dependent peptidase
MTDRTPASIAMSQARTKLLLSNPLLSPGAMRLDMAPKAGIETASTDGRSLFYNEEWVTGLTLDERVGTIAHEVLHLEGLHPWRMGSRDMARWNQACDYAINGLLTEAGFTLPPGALINPDWKGKSAEHIYPLIPEPERDENGQPKPGIGDFTEPAPDDEPQPGEPAPVPLEDQWKSVAAVAEQVAEKMKAGTAAGDLARMVAESRATKTPWQAILKEFVEHCVPSDTSWSKYDKRTAHLGIRLPGTVKENTAPLVVFVDTSGSVDETMTRAFGREITTIMEEARPARIEVVYIDTEVRGVETFYPDDGPVILNAQGGGGTLFQPAFDWLKEQCEPYAGCIYLTDLECADRPEDPGIPTLWVVTESTHRTGPFGQTIRFQQDY